MSFWLARDRKGQHSDHIQRFDPRFWTINFPRPMMASVVTTAPDALRVDCTFFHQGELAGLIWESEDRLDHPLLAYETQRDYAHCVLRFRWRSGGVLALDVPHGPTLTIEGRDAAGQPRAWYVRLWNYASGTPSDAQIELPFSSLQSGYGLPGEAVHPADIDRMFISLVPQGYVEGSETVLPAPVDGWAELTALSCEGEHASLEIGDVLIPAHGEQIATAYDDSFNQTPARLLRNIEGLGYRGRIVHYVGMSHYFRLEPLGGAHYVSLAGGVLNGPCEAWHRAYAAAAREHGFDLIWSLSYELFDAHCWNDWKQRAPDGAPALTGWVPPSTLLSPAHGGAMAYLQQVARAFVTIAQDAALPVLFQIGEPWWWTVPATGAPCLYDQREGCAGGRPGDDRVPARPARSGAGRAARCCGTSAGGFDAGAGRCSARRGGRAGRDLAADLYADRPRSGHTRGLARQYAHRLAVPRLRPPAAGGLRLADRRCRGRAAPGACLCRPAPGLSGCRDRLFLRFRARSRR